MNLLVLLANSLTILSLYLTIFYSLASAEEIVVKIADLPFASMQQEIIYSTSEKQYNLERDSILKRLKNGDFSALNNPIDGSTKIVQTTATIGISWKGIGTSEGRKHLRKITSAEEALYLYENLN